MNIKSIIFPFIFILIFSILPLSAQENSVVEDPDDIYKNVLDINPTSDGFYIGYERVLLFSEGAILVFDVKNTTESGDDFGRSGFTFRYGFTPDSIFSSRIETAWIDGHNNIAFKVGYDSPFMGISLTGVKSLSDSEVLQSEDTVISSSSVSADTKTGSSGSYDNYRRDTSTTNQVSVKETKFATPDGIILDINFNVFKQFNLTLGGSHWEVDDWSETGYHGNIAWNITKGDTIGGHVANIDGNTEGGIYYKKRFNSLGDIVKKGAPFTSTEAPPLFNRIAATPFSTPPIKIMTSSEFVETHEEVKVEETTETFQVRKPMPEIITYDLQTSAMFPGEVVYSIEANDPDGSIVYWSITSNGNVMESGTSATASHFFTDTNGTHTYVLTVRDNDGNEVSESQTKTVF